MKDTYLNSTPILIQAHPADLLTLENMARFYLYEMSRFCGFRVDDFSWPEDNLLKKHHFEKYLEEEDRKAFFIKVQDELAGLVLVTKIGINPNIDWKIGEFFVLPKFQRQSIGQKIALQVFNRFPGRWEVSVLPENKGAWEFWRKVISSCTKNDYLEEKKTVNYASHNPERIVFLFSLSSAIININTLNL